MKRYRSRSRSSSRKIRHPQTKARHSSSSSSRSVRTSPSSSFNSRSKSSTKKSLIIDGDFSSSQKQNLSKLTSNNLRKQPRTLTQRSTRKIQKNHFNRSTSSEEKDKDSRKLSFNKQSTNHNKIEEISRFKSDNLINKNVNLNYDKKRNIENTHLETIPASELTFENSKPSSKKNPILLPNRLDNQYKEEDSHEKTEKNKSPLNQENFTELRKIEYNSKTNLYNSENKYSNYKNQYIPKEKNLKNFQSHFNKSADFNKSNNQYTVDRSKIAPFLLRVFLKINGEHTLNDFAIRSKEPVQDELQLYFWMDTNLRELVNLVKDVCDESRNRNSIWKFKLIYTDKQGRNYMSDIGSVHSTRIDPRIDKKTLQQINFQIGDFIDISISTAFKAKTNFNDSANFEINKISNNDTQEDLDKIILSANKESLSQ